MLKRKGRLAIRKRIKLFESFANDLTATQAANVCGVNRNTVNLWYADFRLQIVEYLRKTLPQLSGEVELDESYFGGPRRKKHANDRRKRGRGAENKVPVFGILKRGGKVYTQVIKNAEKRELVPIIRLIIKKKSTVYTDKWKSYDGLVLDGYKHYRINHSKQYSDRRGTHINGIENFWSCAKRRLSKFNGVSRRTSLLHLKECEFRCNYKRDRLHALKKFIRLS